MSLLRKDFRASLFHLEVRAPSLSLSLFRSTGKTKKKKRFSSSLCACPSFVLLFYAGAFVCAELFCVDELEKKMVFIRSLFCFSLSRLLFSG